MQSSQLLLVTLGLCVLASTASSASVFTQAITFPTLTSSTFVGITKSTYEKAYGEAIGIFNTAGQPRWSGSTVTSTVARRAAVVTFQVSVESATNATAATTAANAMNATHYKIHLNAMIVALNASAPGCSSHNGCVIAYEPTNVAQVVTPSPPSTPSTPSTSSATTPSTPAPPTTITQAITFPLAASSYVGLVKSTYEAAYGKAIGIFNTTAKAIKTGCTVTSTAARRSAVVTFVATVPPTDATAATTAANGMTAASYKTALDATIVTLNVAGNVTAHTPTNVATAVITGGATTSGAYKTPASVLMALVLSFLVAAMH